MSKIINVNGYEIEAGANLGGANLGWADLRGANLGGANLGGANLGGADLRGANLRDANLGGANLRDANLEGANLEGADLRYADLRYADLAGANLEGADLRWAILSNQTLLLRYHVNWYWDESINDVKINIGCQTITLKKLKGRTLELEVEFGGNNGVRFMAEYKSLIIKEAEKVMQ